MMLPPACLTAGKRFWLGIMNNDSAFVFCKHNTSHLNQKVLFDSLVHRIYFVKFLSCTPVMYTDIRPVDAERFTLGFFSYRPCSPWDFVGRTLQWRLTTVLTFVLLNATRHCNWRSPNSLVMIFVNELLILEVCIPFSNKHILSWIILL